MGEEYVIYHYAVWKASYPMMVPACMTSPDDRDPTKRHGITINRGDVSCVTCSMMMDGLTVEQWLRWEMRKKFLKHMQKEGF